MNKGEDGRAELDCDRGSFLYCVYKWIENNLPLNEHFPPPAPLFLLALRVYIKLQEKCLSYGRYVYLLNRLFVTCSMMT